MPDWATRIPRAIEEGKRLLRKAGWDGQQRVAFWKRGSGQPVFSNGELALAEALWEVACEETPPDIAADYPALIAYTEKIESLGGGE